MLYPDFNDLVAYKDHKIKLKQLSTRSVKSATSGNHHSPFRGQGLEFDSVREYVPGDDIRSIDWRVTARTGSPHLKLFKEDRERHIILCIDMNATMRFGTRSTFKSVQAAHIAALLGWKGIAQHDRVDAFLYGDVPNGIQFFPTKQTRKSLCSLLKMLAEPPTEHHEVSLAKTLKHVCQTANTGSLIYVISDFMDIDKELQNEPIIGRLKKRCDIVFIAVNDQADQTLYPIGAVGFHSNPSEKIFVNTDSLKGRELYETQWKENRQHLYEIATQSRIPMIELTTESDIRRDLILELKKIARRKNR